MEKKAVKKRTGIIEKRHNMKKVIALLTSIALIIGSLGLSNISVNAMENGSVNEIVTEQEEKTTETDITDGENESSEQENEIEQEENSEVEEQTPVNPTPEEVQNEEASELTDRANSWRYQDGELIIQGSSFRRSRARAYNPNATRKGIDVSHHNGVIDWEKVKAAGVDFVIIRCGYGQNQTNQDDRQWERNVSECERLGIPYGVYLYSYATNTSAAMSEAQHVLRLIRGHRLSYPVYFDMEDNSTVGSDLAAIASTFCNTIRSAGYPVGVYANLNWWNNYLTNSCFSQWYKWVAQYNDTCNYTGKYEIWQYSANGNVDGITEGSGRVDMNYLIGYPEDHGTQVNDDITDIPEETKNIITYSAHISNKGWLDSVGNGVATGAICQNQQLEAIKLNVNSETGIGVSYQTLIKGQGWQDTKSDDEISGTVGEGIPVNAIRIQLTGENATQYDIYYRTYLRGIGWLDWAKNGAESGSEDVEVEAYQVVVLPSGSVAPGNTVNTFHSVNMNMQAHASDYGWLAEKNNGNIIGTTGQGKGLEAYRLSLEKKNLGISYSSCVAGNWQNEVSDGAISGTTGQSKHIEAIRVNLTGEEKDNYQVYYRVHVSNLGWLGWTCDGQSAGTKNYGYPIEAIQVYVVSKDISGIPELGEAYKEKIDNVRYQAHVSNVGWQKTVVNGKIAGTTGEKKAVEAYKVETDISGLTVEYASCDKSNQWQSWVTSGEISGTVGASKALEAIKIRLSGEESEKYNVYYRAHVSNFGWLGWTSNGEAAGSKGYGNNIEAIQIMILPEGDANTPELGESYKEKGIDVAYRAHVHNVGWQSYVEGEKQAGTTGRSLPIEALQIKIENSSYEGKIEYCTHVSNIGWQPYVEGGKQAGTTGRTLSVEAMKIKLTGELAEHYDIYYRAHVSNIGWQNWVKNDEIAGTTGKSLPIEAVQIKLVEK